MIFEKQLFLTEKKFTDYLISHFNTSIENATDKQIYYALSIVVSELIYDKINNNIIDNSTLLKGNQNNYLYSNENQDNYTNLKERQNNNTIYDEKLIKNINLDDTYYEELKTNQNILDTSIQENNNNDTLRQINNKYYEILKESKELDEKQNTSLDNIKSSSSLKNEILHSNTEKSGTIPMLTENDINRQDYINLDNNKINELKLDEILNIQTQGLEKLKNKKTVHYLSIEFLIGKSLYNNLWSLGLDEYFKNLLKKHGKDIENVYNIENDAGLGNGGLGRLASCYLESLAKCGYNSYGHSIKYEFGLFQQKIIEGKQEQFPDRWLDTGRVWLSERNDKSVIVKIGGRVVEHYSDEKGLSFEIINDTKVVAVPFDYMVMSFGSNNTSTLRLWEARAKDDIDLHLFDVGEYNASLKNNTKVSTINKLLYPNDSTESGKDLRLIQQYFLVSAVVQSVIKECFENVLEKNIDKHYFEKEKTRKIYNDDGSFVSSGYNIIYDNLAYKNLSNSFSDSYYVRRSDRLYSKICESDNYFESEKYYNGFVNILRDKNLVVSSDNIEKLKNLLSSEDALGYISNLVSLHINDTHPALCVPELMRVLIDDYHYGWDESWDLVKKVISYTNHTILSESLEVKRLSSVERIIPRIALILKEIDRRFRLELIDFYRSDLSKVDKLSIISGNNIYMANLAVVASRVVNGVSKIHSEILQTRLFKDYAYMFPNKFINITNGISFRRWLYQSNRELTSFISSLIGDGFINDASKLKELEKFESDDGVLKRLGEIKYNNKVRFSDYVKSNLNVYIDPKFRFDIQAKRIHEYKRQLMNIMKVIFLMQYIKDNPSTEHTKQVFIFAGKSASSYKIAKRIIELIVSVSKEIESDNVLSDKLKVVFLENYNVSMAEIMMTATEVSEQISVAGREASGTGNMKAVLNGALMLCTSDGANIEICDKCGRDNMFEFGLKSYEVEKIISRGYNAMKYYEESEKIRVVINKLQSGINGEKYDDIASYLLGKSGVRDVYMCLADFDDYILSHFEMDRVYNDSREWNRRTLHSIANMGYFSADRSITEYAHKVWKL